MAISSRFAVAIHLLSLIETGGARQTSEWMASSVNTNPVVVRRILGMLNRAGLVTTRPGVAGAELARPLHDIPLLDVYRAVNPRPEDELFAIHDNPNPDCRVGRNIRDALELVFGEAQRALEESLAQRTMADVAGRMVDREPADEL